MDNKFEYTYSAAQQSEIEKIRSKYITKEETKLEQLRRLDKSVEKPGATAALIIGIIGTLIFGAGMSCTMMWQDYMAAGIAVGVVGMAVMALAYPVYKKITAKRKAKIAPQILELSEEIEKGM